jgi:lipopolysaccharide export LptBFGC system permease protein LptF
MGEKMKGFSPMKAMAFLLIIAGVLLFCFETLMVIGESHLAVRNLHWIIGFYIISVLLFAVGLKIFWRRE